MKVALIGYGYWGKKVYQTLTNLFSSQDITVVDPYLTPLSKGLQVESLEFVLLEKDINYVFIVTPEETHFKIAKQCLENGKNIFVEKPLCLKESEAQELHKIAKKNKLKIFVDYIFIYDSYVKKIKQIIEKELLGDVVHIESVRHSININKPNVSVFDDLATHDIYLGKYFLEKNISSIKTRKESIKSKQINQALVTFYYGKLTFSAHYSWVQPIAKRVMTFIGSKASLVWDKDEKCLQIYKNQKLLKKVKVEEDKSPLEVSIAKFLFKNNNYNYSKDVKFLEKLNSL
jgi:predicted dehydrogenase